ncbi:MAG: serine hydrolase, partial [Chitinophagaceae bacterium]
AIAAGRLSWADIEMHCKKVLRAKYDYGLGNYTPINTRNLTADLNAGIPAMRKLVAENAITLALKADNSFFPLSTWSNNKKGDVAVVALGIKKENAFVQGMKGAYNAKVYYADNVAKNQQDVDNLVKRLKKDYKKVVIAVHNMGRTPGNNFGLTETGIALVNALQQQTSSVVFQFGNAYAAKNWCEAKNLVICYEDDETVQGVALEMLQGKLSYKGVLPVTVCNSLQFGESASAFVGISPNQWALDMNRMQKIDSIANDAIANKAAPGCVVLVLKDGKIAFEKAYGSYTYDGKEPMTVESVFDMASVTKICATTISIMKLYEEGKIDLNKTLGTYLPFIRGSNKENLTLKNILLHQAGLVSYIPFYKETVDAKGVPLPGIYSPVKTADYSIRVADSFYMANAWKDSIDNKILRSAVGTMDKYVYSDNDFILLGRIVEAVSGLSLDNYVAKTFYAPMSLTSIGFRPLQKNPVSRIVPTEDESIFRRQLLRGDVHDPGAAMMGGVAGHAGLFSNAYDIAAVMQMLLNGGTYNGKRYLLPETVALFTAYQSDISRRGLGFDKPEKNNSDRKEPYPTLSASGKTFGHTGFTGTCTWADPVTNLVYVFLSNRVHPSGSNTLLNMSVRPKIHETIYQALMN